MILVLKFDTHTTLNEAHKVVEKLNDPCISDIEVLL